MTYKSNHSSIMHQLRMLYIQFTEKADNLELRHRTAKLEAHTINIDQNYARLHKVKGKSNYELLVKQ